MTDSQKFEDGTLGGTEGKGEHTQEGMAISVWDVTPKRLTTEKKVSSKRSCMTSSPKVPLHHHWCVPLCVTKTCVERPVFAQMVGELGAADPSKYPRAYEANACSDAQSDAPRRS